MRPIPHMLAALALATLAQAEPAAPAPTLQDLLARSLQDSPALAAARARMDAADARLDQARAAYRPVLATSERFTTSTDPPTAFMEILQQGRLTPAVQADLNNPERTDDWMTSVGMRWTAFAGGRRRALREGAEADQKRSQLLELAAERDVRLQVTEAWLGLATARAEVALWESTVALFEGHERTARARHEEGAALRSEPLLVAVRRDDARESLLAARRAVDVARARLAAAVGCSIAETGPGPQELPQPASARDQEAVVAAARTQHPLVLAADAAVEAATAAERGAHRLRGPSIYVDVRQDWHGDDESFSLERDSWTATVVADWVLSDFGRSAAAIRESVARRLEAEAMRRALQDALELTARTAHAEALEAHDRVGLADGSVEAAQAALAIVEERWKAGLAPVVDLLDAERTVADARTRALTARARALAAEAALERLAGPASEPAHEAAGE